MKQLLITIAALVLVGCGPSAPDDSIHEAAIIGNIELVRQHLAAGTDMNAKDRNGDSPLDLSANRGHKEITELLIVKGGNINLKGNDGSTPLHLAVLDGRYEIVGLLIANGADMNAKNDGGETPLDGAYGNMVAL